MVVETFILDRNKGMLQIKWDFINRDIFSIGTGCDERSGFFSGIIKHR